MAKLDIRGETECWPWKASTYNHGYGVFTWRGKLRGANRVAWEIAHGQDAPDDMEVMHSCDNKVCCNPRHLQLGTHQENVLDVHRKQRHPVSALTHDQVRLIRRAMANGVTRGLSSEIAKQIGAKRDCVWRVMTGRTYLHVA